MAKQKSKSSARSGYGYGGYGGNGYGGYGKTDSMFAVQEAYKAIRTNIILSVIKDGCKKLVITSSVPHEGKSTTAVNLSISLAQAFKRVLLVDCDLRKAKIHRALGIPGDPGLTNVLSGLADITDAVHATKYQNLYCLPAGLAAPNPAEMLASERMSSTLAQLETQFDYIIFDTPPINVVSDALPLIKISDGVVLIVRTGITVYSDFDQALSALEFIEAHIVGVIVNDDNGEEEGGYGGYGKYGKYGKYGSSYGYGGYDKRRSVESEKPAEKEEKEEIEKID